jgi:hypothetical protein
MPSWGEILGELQESARQRGGQPDLDGIRRKYLEQLHRLTNRDVILYSTDWLGGGSPVSAITLADMQGMMEVCRGLKGPGLDLILHSPGGSPEATASIVRYIRRKFTDIRVFVPLAAMSAATMWALACDEIWMGKHSQLGPIDPQMVTAQGQFPARAVIEQFERAKSECSKDPSLLGAWLPILQQYGPALLKQCEDAEALAKQLVREWLETYMFAGDAKAPEKAQSAADYFADSGVHHSHSLGIDRDQVRSVGIKVYDLESDQALQDAVLSVHHAVMHTFAGAAVKVVENHLGRAYVQIQQVQAIQFPQQIGNPVPATPPK